MLYILHYSSLVFQAFIVCCNWNTWHIQLVRVTRAEGDVLFCRLHQTWLHCEAGHSRSVLWLQQKAKAHQRQIHFAGQDLDNITPNTCVCVCLCFYITWFLVCPSYVFFYLSWCYPGYLKHFLMMTPSPVPPLPLSSQAYILLDCGDDNICIPDLQLSASM